MAATQKGRNRAGIKGGLVELPNPQTISTYIAAPELIPGIKVYGDCFGWKIRQEGKSRPRMGRGSQTTPNYRYLSTPTSGMLRLHQMQSGWPQPSAWKGARGDLVHIIHIAPQETGGANVERKITIPVMLTDWAIDYDTSDPNKDTPWPAIGWVATGPAVFSGWPSTQPTHTEPTKTNQQQWENTSFTLDPQGLQSSLEFLIDWWDGGVGDNDPSEISYYVALIAGKSLPAPFKARPGTGSRNAVDGGIAILRAGLTDTKDDVVLPLRVKSTTVGGTANSATSADINSQPGNPGVFNTVYNGQTIRILNDGKTLFENRYDKWDDIQAYQLGGSFLIRDPSTSHINDAAKDVKVFTTSDGPPTNVPVPPGLKVVSQVPQNINAFQSTFTTGFGKLDSLDQILVPKQRTGFDPNLISEDATRTKEYFTDAVAPTVPDDPPTNNVKSIGWADATIYKAIGSVPGLKIRAFVYGPRDSRDELILPNYETTTDSSSLTGSALRAILDGESEPSTPSGLIERDRKSRPVTLSLGTNRTVTVILYGVRTHEQDITFPGTRVVTEATNLVKNPTVTVVTSSATPDFDALNPDATNLSLWWGVSHQETNSGQWVNAAEFRPLAPDQEMTAQFEVDDIDPAMIQDGSVRVLYNATSTPDSPPAVSGKVHFRTTVKRVGKVKYRYVYEYRYRTSVQAMAAEKYRVVTDISGIESRAATAVVYLIVSPPVTPTYSTYSLDSSFVLADQEDVETPNPLYRLRVYSWALLTNLEKLTFPQNRMSDNPFGLFTRDVFTLENSTTGTSIDDFGMAQRNAFVGSKEYGGIVAHQYNRNLKTLRRRLINDSKTVRGSIGSGNSPSYLGNVGSIVSVARALANGPNQTEIILQSIEYWRIVGAIYVTRRFTVTSDITETILHVNQMNKVNNGALLGINAGFLMYKGAQFTYVGGLPTARPTGVVYKLLFDILRFQSSVSTRIAYYGNAGITPGQQNITGLGIGVGVTFPLSDDLSFIWT